MFLRSQTKDSDNYQELAIISKSASKIGYQKFSPGFYALINSKWVSIIDLIKDELKDFILSVIPPRDYNVVTSGTDTYTGASTPSLRSNKTEYRLWVNFGNANTGPVTLQVGQLAAIPVKKRGGQELVAGDIKAGEIITLIYDGTNYQAITLGDLVQYFVVYGNGTTTIVIPELINKTLLTLVTDGVNRNFDVTKPPTDATFTSATGTIVFASIIDAASIITGTYK